MADIVSIVIVASEGFSISPEKLCELQNTRGGAAPEHSVLHPGWLEAYCDSRDGTFLVQHFFWQGMGSGRTFELLRDVILPEFQGSADLVLNWDDQTVSGLRLVNGNVVEHEVGGGKLLRVVPQHSGAFRSLSATDKPKRSRRDGTR